MNREISPAQHEGFNLRNGNKLVARLFPSLLSLKGRFGQMSAVKLELFIALLAKRRAALRSPGLKGKIQVYLNRRSDPTFFSPLGFLRCYIQRLIMTVIETIMRDIQSLSLREQVQVARYVQRLSATARRKRVAVLRKTHGSLDDADGRAFEEAVAESRKMEAHG